MSRLGSETWPEFYARVTDAVVADLEYGVRPWIRPWKDGRLVGRVSRPLRANLKPFGGINVLILWAEADVRGFVSPVWMTARQAKGLGGRVRDGEVGVTIVYSERVARPPGAVRGRATVMKRYQVFNAEQVVGLPERFAEVLAPGLDLVAVRGFFEQLGSGRVLASTRVGYDPEADVLRAPPIHHFMRAENYYASLVEAFVRWSGHPSRLDRVGRRSSGFAGVTREALVAELGTAFLCADLGLEPRIEKGSILLTGRWLHVMKTDPRFVFHAAGEAQRAVEFLRSVVRGPPE